MRLGNSGMITLMTTRDGGYTLDGDPFESGDIVTVEAMQYRLTLMDASGRPSRSITLHRARRPSQAADRI